MDLNEYEGNELAAIRAWHAEEPGVIGKAFGLIAAPAAWLVQRVIPEAAMHAAIHSASALGNQLADTKDILREAKVEKIADLNQLDLVACDTLANSVHNWAIGMATSEGLVAGAAGLLGIAVDVPAIITLAFRTIHKVGLCYGYECTSELDNQFAASILSASGANSVQEKVAALAALQAVRNLVAKQTWKAMAAKAVNQPLGREAGVLMIKSLAKQLGVNISKRKAMQAIPVVGAGVGAAVNGVFIKDVGWAARRAFQHRWLNDNRGLGD